MEKKTIISRQMAVEEGVFHCRPLYGIRQWVSSDHEGDVKLAHPGQVKGRSYTGCLSWCEKFSVNSPRYNATNIT